MIKLENADKRFQKCQSCFSDNVMAVSTSLESSTSGQKIHLCDSCLEDLGKQIKKRRIQKLEKNLSQSVRAISHIRDRFEECSCKGHQPFLCVRCVCRETLEEIGEE